MPGDSANQVGRRRVRRLRGVLSRWPAALLGPTPRVRRLCRRLLSWYAPWGLALIFLLTTLSYLPHQHRVAAPLVPALAVLYALTAGLAGRWPLSAWGVMLVGLLAGPPLAPPLDPRILPWPPQQIMAVLVVALAAGLRLSATLLVVVVSTTAGPIAVGFFLSGRADPLANLPGWIVFVVAVAAAGHVLRRGVRRSGPEAAEGSPPVAAAPVGATAAAASPPRPAAAEATRAPHHPRASPRSRLAEEARAIGNPLARLGRGIADAALLAADPPVPRTERWGWWLLRVYGPWAAAFVLFLTTFPYLSEQHRLAWPLIPVVGALHVLPLVYAWETPLRAWRLVVLVALLTPVAPPISPQQLPWPPQQILVALVVLYLVALRHPPPVLAGVWGLTVGALAWGLFASGLTRPLDKLPGAVIIATVVLVVGYLIGARRRIQRQLAEGERRREEAETRRALLEERHRIARELHDVVAHRMSMIVVQAETAPFRLPGLSDDGRQCLADIGVEAREGLREMRRLLGVLRSEDTAAEREPQPGLDRVDQLVAGARRAGLHVDLRVSGSPRPLPSDVELSAYRIAQEGLSNAARHAPGAAVGVEVGYEPHALRVAVVNDPPPVPLPAPVPGRGHGLLGIRERVSLLSGRLDVGPTPEGGYRLAAELPVTDTADERPATPTDDG